ncbi:hypothetical protein DOMOVOI_02560 [Brevundimonas phage vB_BpoS-Domovoi]|uniref:Uncharacterized protein n=1 Tax=Brevundimonas phage vB_BpoS-Domovoi TaxID=2948598 RepID=A0A9E7MQK1_9CAUD|nr:hypothetical protein DOMOVOI_02560 [Brevundimonas phage vB_BpoS-Domovoi]
MTEPLPDYWTIDTPETREAAVSYRLLRSDAPLTPEQRKGAAATLESLVMALEDATPPVLRRMFLDDAIFWCTHWETPPSFESRDGRLVETSGARNWPAVAVLCNDLFHWAVADCEEVSPDQWGEIAAIHKAHGTWGLQVWVARRRKQTPQGPVLRNAGWIKAAEAMGWSQET